MTDPQTDAPDLIAQTERLHEADCRRQEEQRRREADALQAGFEAGKASSIVHGYDAKFWHESYTLLRDAVLENLDDCVREDDVAEEAILVEAIETAGQRLKAAAERGAAVPRRVSEGHRQLRQQTGDRT